MNITESGGNFLGLNEVGSSTKNNIESKNAKPFLMIALHGLGVNGANLLNLAPSFQSCLPGMHFIAPNGIEEFEYDSRYYQWFSLADRNDQVVAKEMERSSVKVNSFIDEQLKKHGLTDENLILCGFSQGGMMAIHLGLMRPNKCAAVLCFSGGFKSKYVIDKPISSPPIALIHGADDMVVPIKIMYESRDLLKDMDVKCKIHLTHGLGHSISQKGIEFAKDFLLDHLLNED